MDQWRGFALGVLIGIAASFVAELILIWFRRKVEKRDVATALYQEVANRVGRVAHDYINPWSIRHDPPVSTGGKTVPIEDRGQKHDVLKFSPQKPVTFPKLVGKIALIDTKAHSRLLHFYYEHHAWGRDLASFVELVGLKDRPHKSPIVKHLAENRMRPVMKSGLLALEALEDLVGANWIAIDQATVEIFPNIKSVGTLRYTLKKLGKFPTDQ